MTKETKTTAVAAALIAAISLVLIYFVSNSLDEKALKEGEKATLETDIAGLTAKVALIEPLTLELDNLKANFAQYIKILPSPEIATQERLMELVEEKCERADFQVSRFETRPSLSAKKSAFQEIEITLTAKGTFEQFLRFVNSLERHESFVRVNSFNCTAPTVSVPDPADPLKQIWPLAVSLNISTFRFDGGK